MTAHSHLVLAGGGHAHLTTLSQAQQFAEAGVHVTLITPDRFHYYSGMGPGLLAGTYTPQECRFNVQRLAEDHGVEFVQARIEGLDPERKTLSLSTGRELAYEAVSFNVGSEVVEPFPVAGVPGVFPVKPIKNLLEARREILATLQTGKAPKVLVLGGGAAGVELAGTAAAIGIGGSGKELAPEVTLLAGSCLLGQFPKRLQELARAALDKRGIRNIEGRRALGIGPGRLDLDDGRRLEFDVLLLAAGVRAPRFLRESGLDVAGDGALLVNRRLQAVQHPELFGGGDCIQLKGSALARVGVYAVRQNPLLLNNLLAFFGHGEFQEFRDISGYLQIINMGDGSGLLLWKGLCVHSHWAFRLKDFIDRRFMRRFQRFAGGAH